MTRDTQAPSYLHEYHVGISLPSRNVSSSNSTLTGPIGITYPLFDVLSYAKLSSKHHAFTILFQLKQGHNLLHKQFVTLNGALPCNKSSLLLRLIEHGLFNHYLLGRNRLDANGCTRSNSNLMILLNVIKRDWSLKDTVK